ncbi:MAG TPA: DNA polymerase IV, partial [Treponemataceae bacterium]|nr:DNA polymerase IV [Treponemataceae bacterium]
MSSSVFIHADLDAFFAAVEQLDNPEYRGKPVIVGGLPTDKRGVVSACSYEARTYGIHSAMPVFNAYKRCPCGIFLRGRMKRYQEKSNEVLQIFSNYSPDVQQISIDEAFIDITGTEKLFGTPEDTAKKIQKEVFEKTGLTLSIGLGTTKYIAKIASDINKPNGIYYVQAGAEKDFMLSLPLKKIWGLGKKTQEKLKNAGLHTTKSVYNASQAMLAGIIGKNTALFLYNAVRGQMAEKFNQKPKSRSLSSERTFPIDINDTYIIETVLMELCYEIMYKMQEKKWNSKTAAIKIRYEDFTTIQAQITTEHCILSAEDLFTKIKNLFYKKYEKSRAIRLIGCGVQNLGKTSIPQQAELFDFEDKKTRAVEKAILELKKKDSSLDVKKARLLTKTPFKTSFAFFFVFFLPFISFFQSLISTDNDFKPLSGIIAKEFPKSIPVEDPKSLYEFSPDNENIEFYTTGTWDTSLSISFDVTKDAFDTVFIPNIPVLKTTIDLSTWFLLFDTWYFEANVADGFHSNTVAAGYYGTSILKHARIGNRYIEFDDTYGISKAGYGCASSASQTPGFMTEWEGTNWSGHSIIRYEKIDTYEKKWIGHNAITQTEIPLNEYTSSLRFVLPATIVVQNIAHVLVETTTLQKADFIDENGVYYKALGSDDFMIIPSTKSLILRRPQTGNILIRFFSNNADSTKEQTLIALGNWDDTDSFLGSIQSAFNIGANEVGCIVNLAELSGTLSSSEHFFIKTSTPNTGEYQNSTGVSSLYLQRKNCFSPFADYSLYTTNSGSFASFVQVQHASTQALAKDFSASLLDTFSLFGGSFTNSNFFDNSFSVIQVYSIDSTKTLDRYPFSTTNPFVYFSNKHHTDLHLSLQKTTAVETLDIGTNATTSTIRVYRNGINEQSFIYDKEKGIISLSPPLSVFDNIRISWSEYSDTAETGLFTAAVGFKKQLSDVFAFDISSSLFYPVSDNKTFASLQTSTPFSIAAAVNTHFKTNSIHVENTLCANLQKENPSDILRVFSMNGDSPVHLYLDANAVIQDATSYMTAKTSRSETNNGYELLIDWNFSTSYASEETPAEAFLAFKFANSAKSIANASEFFIEISGLDNAAFATNTEVILELGVSNDGKSTPLTPRWQLKQEDIVDSIIKIQLSTLDLQRIGSHSAARIIVKTTDINDTNRIGSLTIKKCAIQQSSFVTNCPSMYSHTGAQQVVVPHSTTQPQNMLMFTPEGVNYVQEVSWNAPTNTINHAQFSPFSAIKYTNNIPISQYGKMHFFVYFLPDDDNTVDHYTLQIQLDRPETNSITNAVYLRLLPKTVLTLHNGWHECVFDMLTQTLTIDGTPINTADFNANVNATISPTRLKIEIMPSTIDGGPTTNQSKTASGSLYIDEVYF